MVSFVGLASLAWIVDRDWSDSSWLDRERASLDGAAAREFRARRAPQRYSFLALFLLRTKMRNKASNDAGYLDHATRQAFRL
jgi:hypothetical protein